MPTGLVAYALKFFSDPEAVRREVTAPVLVWEQSSRGEEERGLSTVVGVSAALQPAAGEPLVLPLHKGPSKAPGFGLGITLGRTDNNDVVLPSISVSRFHGYFLQDPRTQQWKLVDAESKNGTWVEGVKLPPNQPETLPRQARLRFGQVEVLFFQPEAFFRHLQQLHGPP